MADQLERQLNLSKDEPSSAFKESGGVPSGFVLKLYQMVNGAPDEVISVSLDTPSFFFSFDGRWFVISLITKLVL